jgi:hypothetical protein
MQDRIEGASSEVPQGPPVHMVACAIADTADTQRAVTQLNQKGLSEDSVSVLHGKEGADALRNRGSGVLQSILIRLNELAGATDDFVQRHIEAADRGEHIILVELPSGDSDATERIWRILASHNAHDGFAVGQGTNYELGEHPK